jgi:2,3-bisphosphoglycerate-dependent phosphoglycerate mutase
MTIYLLRHGQSEGNLASLYSGVSDHALTPLGREQALEAGRQFQDHQFDQLFTSQLSRAVETADLFLQASGAKVGKRQARAELNERNFGVFEGQNEPKGCGAESGPSWRVSRDVEFVPEGGESMRQVHSRAVAFLDEIAGTKNGDVLIVAHGNVLRSMALHALGWPVDMLPDMPSRNCLVTRLRY